MQKRDLFYAQPLLNLSHRCCNLIWQILIFSQHPLIVLLTNLFQMEIMFYSPSFSTIETFVWVCREPDLWSWNEILRKFARHFFKGCLWGDKLEFSSSHTFLTDSWKIISNLSVSFVWAVSKNGPCWNSVWWEQRIFIVRVTGAMPHYFDIWVTFRLCWWLSFTNSQVTIKPTITTAQRLMKATITI